MLSVLYVLLPPRCLTIYSTFPWTPQLTALTIAWRVPLPLSRRACDATLWPIMGSRKVMVHAPSLPALAYLALGQPHVLRDTGTPDSGLGGVDIENMDG